MLSGVNGCLPLHVGHIFCGCGVGRCQICLVKELLVGQETEHRNSELNNHQSKGQDHAPDLQIDVDHDAEGGQSLSEETDAIDSEATVVLNHVDQVVIVSFAGA